VDATALVLGRAPEQEHAVAGVLAHVRPELGDDEREPSARELVEPHGIGQRHRGPARFGDGTVVVARDLEMERRYLHRVILTVVPFPGAVSIEKSLTKRLDPESPNPSPEPVE